MVVELMVNVHGSLTKDDKKILVSLTLFTRNRRIYPDCKKETLKKLLKK